MANYDLDMVWDQFLWDTGGAPPPPIGSGVPIPLDDLGYFGPDHFRTNNAKMKLLLLDSDLNPISVSLADSTTLGNIITGGAITVTAGAVPRIEGTIIVANPNGVLTDVLVEGYELMVACDLTYPNAKTYRGYIGNGLLKIAKPAHSGGPGGAGQLVLTVWAAGSLLLNFSVNGDLKVLAAPVAAQLGLLAADGITASVEGILAWLLMQAGATTIGIVGAMTRTSAYVQLTAAGKFIGGFVYPNDEHANVIVADCMKITGVGYFIAADGTAVLQKLPASVADVISPPFRRWSETLLDPDNVAIDFNPEGGVPLQRVKLINQNPSTGARDVTVIMPYGAPAPFVDTTPAANIKRIQYKRYNVSLFPPTTLDSDDKLTQAAKRIAFLLSLESNIVRLTAPIDPWVDAEQTHILDFPSRGTTAAGITALAEGKYWVKSVTFNLDLSPMQIEFQRLFDSALTGDLTIGGSTYTWGNTVSQLQIGPSVYFGTGGEAVKSPERGDIYHTVPLTLNWFARFHSWPKNGSANVKVMVAHTTICEVIMDDSGGGATMPCTVLVYNEAGSLIATLGPFNVTNNDNAWHEWALQQEAAWVGIWIDGVLKASGTPANTLTAASYYTGLGRYQGVGFMGRSLSDALLQPTAAGVFGLYSARCVRAALFPHTNYTPATAGFGSLYKPSDYPGTAFVWMFTDLPYKSIDNNNPGLVYYVGSLMSDQSGTVVGLNVSPGTDAIPF